MTTITPARDAAVKSLAMLDAVFAQQNAEGTPKAQTDMTKAIVSAVMLSFADQFDLGIPAEDSFGMVQASFINAISSFLDTFATACDDDVGDVAAEFLEGLVEGVADALAHDACLVVKTDGEPMGHA